MANQQLDLNRAIQLYNDRIHNIITSVEPVVRRVQTNPRYRNSKKTLLVTTLREIKRPDNNINLVDIQFMFLQTGPLHTLLRELGGVGGNNASNAVRTISRGLDIFDQINVLKDDNRLDPKTLLATKIKFFLNLAYMSRQFVINNLNNNNIQLNNINWNENKKTWNIRGLEAKAVKSNNYILEVIGAIDHNNHMNNTQFMKLIYNPRLIVSLDILTEYFMKQKKILERALRRNRDRISGFDKLLDWLNTMKEFVKIPTMKIERFLRMVSPNMRHWLEIVYRSPDGLVVLEKIYEMYLELPRDLREVYREVHDAFTYVQCLNRNARLSMVRFGKNVASFDLPENVNNGYLSNNSNNDIMHDIDNY